VARYYTASYQHGGYTHFAAAEEIRTLIAQYRFDVVRRMARPGRWLDVGCAAGHFVEAAARTGIHAEGIDVSAGAIEMTRARGLVGYQSRLEDFEPAAHYDAICAFDVIEHTLDPRLFLKRLRGWLVPGGTLVLTLPNVSSIYPRLLMRRHWFYYAPSDHLYYFNPATLRALLRQCGFTPGRIARTYKPLTLRYIASQLALFNPLLGRILSAATTLLPDSLLVRPWKCYLGEMMAFASPSPRAAETAESP
jgi:2-polyprenyl-3-methyl-5-hydroxy-6-metoxy-1,4-benzoquinol methylase